MTKINGPRRLAVDMKARPGKSDAFLRAETELRPEARNALVAMLASTDTFASHRGPWRGVDVMRDFMAATRSGDMSLPSDILTAQALSLDAIFTECASRSLALMGKNADAAERYMKMAIKAQNNSRAAVEALTRIHSPREQTVRHVHVHDGAQAIVTGNLMVERGKNEKPEKLPHAMPPLAPLSGPDPDRRTVPVSGNQREGPVSDARWKE